MTDAANFKPDAYLLRQHTAKGGTRIMCGEVFMSVETAEAAAKRLTNRWRTVEVAPAFVAHSQPCQDIDALRADKARLDYLDRCNATLNARWGTNYRWSLILNHNVNRLMLDNMAVDLNDMDANGLPSCRDAIDRRMGDGRKVE